MGNPDITMYYFEQNRYIPNHPYLPALHYKRAMENKEDEMEKVFQQNNWKNTWSGGVFSYHHYHSNAHEVLGIKTGSALLQIGGEGGSKLIVKSGDVLLLPAGTGHKKLSASPEFEVIGAYPNGEDYNIKTDVEKDLDGVQEEIESAFFPAADPVYGENGPLSKMWRQK
ncbi:hypothetical protein HRF69_20310 [Bacillus circulans]|jgi:uncharacterized protein YjlB|uniref:Cupin type-1 domain-containing protein n=2 Tax=Niallia circulans TaxID=1397 RepID=A0AA91TU72_NIACI|nr:cupin domain-containing protein [Niallia circulans]AYV73716.1 hypothetical protein C2H98_20325 [Niallia circulans]NRG29450.1 hypothetical protein [Niallia circulans]PAD83562.1 hypothetical protein CHH57_09065 [Niallia circulans]QJX63836.1 hypothetical protein HLK66_20785 [Niallia circulans]UQZ76018.1 hypothetical protein C2I17_16485 [Niallia circulans]